MTAGITTFYMFRMWFMTFTGEPRDQHVYEHAHESPRLMTVPLIVLAVFSVVRRLGLAALGRRGQLPGASASTTPSRRSVHADFGHAGDRNGEPTDSLARSIPPMRDAGLASIATVGIAAWLCCGRSLAASCHLTTARRARPGRREGAVPGVYTLPDAQVVLRRAVQRPAGPAGAGRGAAGAAGSTRT